MKLGRHRGLGAWILFAWLAVSGARAADVPKAWMTMEQDGRIEARRGDALMLGWQCKPLAKPVGGAKFAASAFLHPLRTPAGFEWTTIQPADHLHHFGLWWPWRWIEVDGARYNCWEIQNGQGAQVARSVKLLLGGPDTLKWEFQNEVLVMRPGAPPLTVIRETAQVGLALRGKDTQVLDIALHQRATDRPVTIVEYRYSGFSWRGPASWHKDNSSMLTSEGLGRDQANGTPARWVLVNGPTPHGPAAVLLMSAASEVAGTPERLRVWDSKMGMGTPFVNFNPVMTNSIPLDEAHPAVSSRKYRVLAADYAIDAATAEAEWRKWLDK